MKRVFLFMLFGLVAGWFNPAQAAEAVYSGPQKGEKTTPFQTLYFAGDSAPVERNPIAENAGKPTSLIFLHTVERSLLPLLRVIDRYGAERKDLLQTEIVFLFPDRLEGEQRLKAILSSLKLKGKCGLSLDGAEGPGNYGLNKECMMTVIGAKDNKVEVNFALVQPGVTDAEKIIAALAKLCSDPNPPTNEQILAWGMPQNPMRGEMTRRNQREKTESAKDPFPGAVPTDPTLNSMIRQFIRPANDEATVNGLRDKMLKHIENDPALRQQAIDGWKRILHFGDRYGTEYARKVGADMLASLEKEQQEKSGRK